MVEDTTRAEVSLVCVCVFVKSDDYELRQALRDPTIRADNWIVVTTIRSPTDAVRTLARQTGWKVVVIGDRKTPKTWRCVVDFDCLMFFVIYVSVML